MRPTRPVVALFPGILCLSLSLLACDDSYSGASVDRTSYSRSPTPLRVRLELDPLGPAFVDTPLPYTAFANVVMSDGSTRSVDSTVVRLDGKVIATIPGARFISGEVPSELLGPKILEMTGHFAGLPPVVTRGRFFVNPKPLVEDTTWDAEQVLNVALLVSGAVKVAGTLLVMVGFLIYASTSTPERLAKIVASVLGTLVVALSTVLVPGSGIVAEAFFQPIPSNVLSKLALMAIPAFILYLTLAAFRRLFLTSGASASLEAFVIFILSATYAASIPLMVRVATDAVQVTGSMALLMLSGGLLGGLAYLMGALLDRARTGGDAKVRVAA